MGGGSAFTDSVYTGCGGGGLRETGGGGGGTVMTGGTGGVSEDTVSIHHTTLARRGEGIYKGYIHIKSIN